MFSFVWCLLESGSYSISSNRTNSVESNVELIIKLIRSVTFSSSQLKFDV